MTAGSCSATRRDTPAPARPKCGLQRPARPGTRVRVGLNYVEHVFGTGRLDTERLPDPSGAVRQARHRGRPRHDACTTPQPRQAGSRAGECELAVVIGQIARRVSEQDAWRSACSATAWTDVSARDQRRCPASEVLVQGPGQLCR
ncbi:fumarylacetoacetate hydrolase family protein [Kitasatospora aureofaciens]